MTATSIQRSKSSFRLLMFFLVFVVTLVFTYGGGTPKNNLLRNCRFQWSPQRFSNATITFIVPSKGRSTLTRTLSSLVTQTHHNWLAIIVFDGVLSNDFYVNKTSQVPIFIKTLPTEIMLDGRFCFQYKPWSGGASNCAGEIRNYGIALTTTEWVGFVDDDDTLRPQYVERLHTHSIEYPNVQAVLFRMCNYFPRYGHTRIIPDLASQGIVIDDVGISFSFRTKLFKEFNYHMIPSNAEDYLFMDTLYKNHIPILLSEYNNYFVRDHHHPICDALGSHIYLHYPPELQPYHTPGYECRVIPTGVPKLIVTEDKNPIYHRIIHQIEKAIGNAIERRCLVAQSKYLTQPIHVIFSSYTTPTSSLYIQVLTERPTNSPYYNSYTTEKLSKAVQVWDLTHSTHIRTIPNNITANMYWIPSLLASNTTPLFNCSIDSLRTVTDASVGNSVSSSTTTTTKKTTSTTTTTTTTTNILPSVTIYRFGYYHTCEYHPLQKSWILKSSLSSTCYNNNNNINNNKDEDSNNDIRTIGYCWKNHPRNTYGNTDNLSLLCTDLMTRQESIDTLVIDALHTIPGNKGEEICDSLALLTGRISYCIQNTTIDILNHLVCRTKIVIITQFIQMIPVNTQLITSLLQIKTVVIGIAPSRDYSTYFSTVIPIIRTHKIVTVIDTILSSYTQWIISHHYYDKIDHFLSRTLMNIDPICYALSQLGDTLRSKPIPYQDSSQPTLITH